MKTITLQVIRNKTWSLGITADAHHIGVDLLWVSLVLVA